MSKFAKHCRRLGLDDYATIKEIKSAQRRLTLQFHPDRIADDQEKAAAQDSLAQINDAVDQLMSDAAISDRRSHAASRPRDSHGRFQPTSPRIPPAPAPSASAAVAALPVIYQPQRTPELPPPPSPKPAVAAAASSGSSGWGWWLLGLATAATAVGAIAMNPRDVNGHRHARGSGRYTASWWGE